MAPDYYYIQNAKCNLYYKLAASERDYSHAKEYRRMADEKAFELLNTVGKDEPYIYHIYCGGVYNFIVRWITDRESKKAELQSLSKVIRTGMQLHPGERLLQIANDAINRAYIQMGINAEIEDPEFPSF